MKNKENDLTPGLKNPQETVADKVYGLIKAVVDSAPAGALFSYGLGAILRPPLARRTEKWMSDVSNELNRVGIVVDTLASNERFITTLTQALQIAVKNHREEKLIALRNAVINSIDEPSYPEALQIHFLSLIERFNEWHIRVLKTLRDGNILGRAGIKSFGHAQAATMDALRTLHPLLGEHPELAELVIDDLYASKLVHHEWNNTGKIGMLDIASIPSVTAIGKQFLAFIESSKV